MLGLLFFLALIVYETLLWIIAKQGKPTPHIDIGSALSFDEVKINIVKFSCLSCSGLKCAVKSLLQAQDSSRIWIDNDQETLKIV